MKAMVFAAGLGTRLRPYTNDRPKALVEVGGRTLLEIVFHRLKLAGIEEVVVNVHHYADLVIDILEENKGFGLKVVVSDEREQLLETGGGLKKAQQWLNDEPFLVHNVDVLTNLDLQKLLDFHHKNKVLATLAVRNRVTSRYLHFDSQNHLCGWENTKTKEQKVSRMAEAFTAFAFSGVSIFDPAIFDFMPEHEVAFSTIPVLLEAAKSHKILAYPHDDTIWLDVGKPETLALAEDLLPQLMEGSK